MEDFRYFRWAADKEIGLNFKDPLLLNYYAP